MSAYGFCGIFKIDRCAATGFAKENVVFVVQMNENTANVLAYLVNILLVVDKFKFNRKFERRVT
jgi:hypothetical protein